MNKKHIDTKQSKKTSEPSIELGGVKRLLAVGDNWKTRKLAHKLLGTQNIGHSDVAYLQQVLRITWPDKVALLTGLACLVATVAAAILVAY